MVPKLNETSQNKCWVYCHYEILNTIIHKPIKGILLNFDKILSIKFDPSIVFCVVFSLRYFPILVSKIDSGATCLRERQTNASPTSIGPERSAIPSTPVCEISPLNAVLWQMSAHQLAHVSYPFCFTVFHRVDLAVNPILRTKWSYSDFYISGINLTVRIQFRRSWIFQDITSLFFFNFT